MPRKRRRNKWIKGPLSDWLIPCKYNLWFQLAIALLIVSCVSIRVFSITNSSLALAFAFFSTIGVIPALGLTEFGRGTVQGYRRIEKIIRREGAFDARLQRETERKLYCYRAGARAAANKYGLTQNLRPKLANRWRLY